MTGGGLVETAVDQAATIAVATDNTRIQIVGAEAASSSAISSETQPLLAPAQRAAPQWTIPEHHRMFYVLRAIGIMLTLESMMGLAGNQVIHALEYDKHTIEKDWQLLYTPIIVATLAMISTAVSLIKNKRVEREQRLQLQQADHAEIPSSEIRYAATEDAFRAAMAFQYAFMVYQSIYPSQAFDASIYWLVALSVASFGLSTGFFLAVQRDSAYGHMNSDEIKTLVIPEAARSYKENVLNAIKTAVSYGGAASIFAAVVVRNIFGKTMPKSAAEWGITAGFFALAGASGLFAARNPKQNIVFSMMMSFLFYFAQNYNAMSGNIHLGIMATTHDAQDLSVSERGGLTAVCFCVALFTAYVQASATQPRLDEIHENNTKLLEFFGRVSGGVRRAAIAMYELASSCLSR